MRCYGDAGPEDGDTGTNRGIRKRGVMYASGWGGDDIRGGKASCPDWVMRGRGSRADYHFFVSESRMRNEVI